MPITQATLVDYLNNELGPAERERVGAALQRDPRLRAELDRLRRLHQGLQAAFDPIRDVPIAARPAAPSARRPPRRLARLALLAAVALAGFWLVGRRLPQSLTGGEVAHPLIATVPETYVPINPPTPTSFVPTPFVPTDIPTEPAAPTIVLPEPGSAEWYAYLAISPSLDLRGELAGNVLDIAVRGTVGYALMVRPEAGGNPASLVALDLADPGAPGQLGSIPVDPDSRAIAVDGTLAIATTPRGFDVFDISDPARIALIGSFADAQQNSTVVVALRAGRAYVTSQGAARRFTIVDMTDPANPRRLGSLATVGPAAEGLDIAGELAFVADAFNGLQVIDISDPAAPRLLGGLASPGARSVRSAGGRAYLGTDHGLEIIDISDPAAPALLGGHPVGFGSVTGIALGEGVVFVSYANIGSSDFGGMEAYNVGDPTRPLLLGGYSGQAYAHAVWTDGARAYVAHDRRGLIIMDLGR
ncbi:MAG TPA: hypothetical protein VD886_24860 [Herpetosiphonaceae bacterium]|nr:hypothetical protein [Herpetosiphonaceae bacterium]